MKYILLFILSCLSLLTGCQDETESLLPGTIGQAATFTAVQNNTDVTTRATDQNFQTGDEIGIYIVKRNGGTPANLQPSGNYADNKRYVIADNGTLQPYGESDKIYFSLSETYDIYAYYPYNSSISNPANYYFTTKLDQTNKQDYTQSDLMTAHSVSNSNSGVISLIFERKLGLVEIHFSKVPGKTVTAATINGVKITTILNLNTGTTTYNNNTWNIKMSLYQENTSNYIFRAILPVQELQGDYLFDFTIDGETVQYKAKSVTPLAAGKKSLYLLNLQYHIRAYERDGGTGYVTGAEKEIFNHGETINLIAFPAFGFEFSGWYESPLIGWQQNLKKVSDSPNYSFSASKNIWMIAVMSPIYRNINIDISTVGINQGGYTEGAGKAAQGRSTTVIAFPYNGYNFDGWYEDNKLLSTDKEYTFTVPARDVNLVAKFSQSFKVILNATQGGDVVQTNSNGVYLPYEQCTIKAIPKKGYIFTGWFVTGETNSFTAYDEYTFNVNGNFNFTAQFTSKRHLITVSRDFGVDITGTERYYLTGETCTLVAKMTDPYKAFNGYFYDKECTQLITKSDTYSFTVDDSRTIYTQCRDITHFNFNHVFWFQHATVEFSQAEYVVNTHTYPTYTATLKAGERARYESTLVWNEAPEKGDYHKNTMQITNKTLVIKQNGREVATINQPDNYIFTAPTTATYEFIYTGTCKTTVYKGEKCTGYQRLTVALWKEETLK